MVKRIAVIAILLWVAFQVKPIHHARLTMLDVGQGLSILFEDQNGWRVLYDTGPQSVVLPELGRLMAPWDNHIDVLAISHGHSDHLEGAIEILQRYRIDEIWLPPDLGKSEIVDAFRSELARHPQITIRYPLAGWLRLAAGGQRWDCWHPDKPNLTSVHANTLVLSWQAPGQHNFLLTGDLDAPDEKWILDRCAQNICPPSPDIFEVSHHGSRETTSAAWLAEIQPKLALISVGTGNTYGHPHQETIDRLQAAKIPIWRTDQNGPITINLDQRVALQVNR